MKVSINFEQKEIINILKALSLSISNFSKSIQINREYEKDTTYYEELQKEYNSLIHKIVIEINENLDEYDFNKVMAYSGLSVTRIDLKV